MSEPAQPQPQQQPQFQIEKLYVKDVSLEVPNSPEIFLQIEAPELEVEVTSGRKQFGDGMYEVVVTVTVTARTGGKTLFLATAAQAGIFAVRGVPAPDLDPLLGIGCPTILYPYVREVIADLVMRAGFPPVVLAPMSFEQLYMEKQQKEAAAAAAPPPQP
jgi:preprotein translocase subunit SecB